MISENLIALGTMWKVNEKWNKWHVFLMKTVYKPSWSVADTRAYGMNIGKTEYILLKNTYPICNKCNKRETTNT